MSELAAPDLIDDEFQNMLSEHANLAEHQTKEQLNQASFEATAAA